MKFNRIGLIFAVFFAIAISPALGVTDTVYVQKRITDTLYVVSPPDTVYIQESSVQAQAAPITSESTVNPAKNEFITDYSTDTIPPANKFYIGGVTAFTLFSLWFGVPMFDLDYEIENTFRGSLIFNLSGIFEFYEYSLHHEDPTWEGFRSIISPGVGYRQYVLTFITSKVNPKKLPIKFKNTPLNSLSLYLQAMASPSFKLAYDKTIKKDDFKSGSFDAGFAASASFGSVWNLNNILWEFGFTSGYQHWSDKSRKYLTKDLNTGKTKYRYLNGWCAKGFFIGTDFKIGF
ncbi:hypothetical protein [Fibrobacter sp.]|uniref:hypothetical protein n=1 Tax=Fibrobacter sp. TaxID=35828 RepID=UPI003868FDA9